MINPYMLHLVDLSGGIPVRERTFLTGRMEVTPDDNSNDGTYTADDSRCFWSEVVGREILGQIGYSPDESAEQEVLG